MTYCSNELRDNGVDEERIELRLQRRARGLTLKQAAKLVGIDASTLARYEIGDTGVRGGRAVLHGRTQRALARLRARWRVEVTRESTESRRSADT